MDVASPRQRQAVLTRSQSHAEEMLHGGSGGKKDATLPSALTPVAESEPSQNSEFQDQGVTENTAANDLVKMPRPEQERAECSAAGNRSTEKPDVSERPEVPTPLLSPLNEPVPADWVTVEDEFIFVLATYLTHIGADNIAAPSAKLDDGIIHMGLGHGGLSRSEVFALFTAMTTGEIERHISHNLEIFPVKAFRLEPITPNGIITVDGEKVDYGPIQAQVLPGIARVMTLQKWGKRC